MVRFRDASLIPEQGDLQVDRPSNVHVVHHLFVQSLEYSVEIGDSRGSQQREKGQSKERGLGGRGWQDRPVAREVDKIRHWNGLEARPWRD